VGSFFWLIAAIFSGIKFSVTLTVCLWHLEGETSSLARTLKALYWTMRYHLGTVFFGSLVLLIAGACKSICQYVVSRVPTSGNALDIHWILAKCIMCLVTLAEKAIRYFNEQVYCQVALSSESYCTSARSVFSYMSLATLKFDTICEFLLFTGRLLISLVVTLACKFILERKPTELLVFNTSGANLVTLIVIFCISWTVTSIFSYIWSAACESLITLQAIEQKSGLVRFDSKISNSLHSAMEMMERSTDYA
jgi:hypothetical protein